MGDVKSKNLIRTSDGTSRTLKTPPELRITFQNSKSPIRTSEKVPKVFETSGKATLFITQLNQLIDETRTAYNQRKSIAASNKDKGQGGNDERPGEL